ncbi:outer membrane protein [Pseudoxanthomonas sp. GM95]|uniref:MipA/OmpV family protein n=1 Tax=Pseudoxanthomonas sp. GM95 TaxID=1881043 RepID=UPI0008C185B8|nr:MipA/OmpV family protein [Pseudoxanthomonas sp. GM95]SEL94481.1 outer membrane protein [Pseudoxanthomonas sp. GM95]
MTLKAAASLFCLFPSIALAQSPSSTSDLLAKQEDDRWTIGVGASVKDDGYAGEGTRVRPFPLIGYEGERVFWRGLTGGVHVIKGEAFTLDAVLAGRFDGFDIDDLGRKELAANGLNADLLEDRDDGLDAGLSASWRGAAGELKLSALADVTDSSGGYEFAADYGYALHWGRTTLVPSVGVRWMSSDLVDYYYGTLDEEVARGVVRYQPGSAVVPQVGVGFSRPLGEHWKVTGSVNYKFLPSEITDSPLMDPDVSGAMGVRVGIGWSF